ncbi:bifunctional proline dehydrogenase/L-glutamate gamma-semialdehyde dehydrogenase PutA [Thioalkalicoccus limnaeus]|uniref:Bifunctional protein PutA n=1 Tax=Thioalkalicoccus limnaeus TaxID=120681 RepID=A0ABV4BF94_9GAMM
MPALTDLSAWRDMNAARFADEQQLRDRAIDAIAFETPARARVLERARDWVRAVRRRGDGGLLDRFLAEFGLTSREGIALMCLAEAALRIPDDATLDELIRDKLGGIEWRVGGQKGGGSLFVNASTWALMLTGRLLEPDDDPADPETGLFASLRQRIRRGGEPLVRQAMRQAMAILGRQFVMGRDIDEALARSKNGDEARYRHSFDMLGEAARTADDAQRYFERYQHAIGVVGRAAAGAGPIDGPGISIKLSALHPRFEPAQWPRVRPVVVARTLALARDAAQANIGLTMDAEEASRLDLQLDVLAALCAEPALTDWQGLGLALQAYQRRALDACTLLGELADRRGRRLMVRLVKGAYWDSEIKLAQQLGLPGYPVFTRKVNTDLNFLACARRLFDLGERVYPQFATHNAHSIAAVLEMADGRPFELQRLHGMGEALHAEVLKHTATPCRAYDPVGSHDELLPYLVRRLLENGANSSFVHRIADATQPLEQVVTDPIEVAATQHDARHPRIPAPRDLYRPDRVNSAGLDLGDPDAVAALYRAMDAADHHQVLRVQDATPAQVSSAIAAAADAFPAWDLTPAVRRAQCLETAADQLEAHLGELVALCCREAGKSIPDGIAEVREAADFCRYYAARAREAFAAPLEFPGPTGERNQLSLHGRGVFVCISPWNFPLAIFVGQVAAALAAGNTVVAKPAEQTPLIAARAVELLRTAGIAEAALQLVPGDGPSVGAPLVADPRIAGVAFTGSVATARAINRRLAERDGPIVPLIAETGGQNAMVVDSSALPEQVITDVLQSSFQSAGQRCSALRVLFIQEDVAERMLTMLAGAMAELRIGAPWDLATDVGPVIDADAQQALAAHCARMDREARLIYRCPLPPETASGSFIAPVAYEIDGIEQLEDEVFGPVPHVVRYRADALDEVIAAINGTGFGLTFGVHSRIDRHINLLTAADRAGIRAGNRYVNRNMIGAVVGVQPFGGEGLSGTGPKAGGPHYLPRFAVERVRSFNTAATGGDAALLSLDEDPSSTSRTEVSG